MTNLKLTVLCLNGNDLIPNQLKNPVHYRLKALENLLIGESHVTFLNTSVREFSLNTDINSPFLTIVSKVGLDSVFKVHDALGVHSAGRLRSIGELHLSNLSAKDIGEVTVECS